jgi:DNA-binding response OmpR family regulator
MQGPVVRERFVDALPKAGHYRVLVVDDESPILGAVREYFGALALRVDTAQEREEAEALILTTPYDLVVADMRLTGIHGREGLELARFVREYQPATRVIIMTAHGSGELEEEVRRCGADRFLQKPIPLSDLAAEAFRLLGAPMPAPVFHRRRGEASCR